MTLPEALHDCWVHLSDRGKMALGRIFLGGCGRAPTRAGFLAHRGSLTNLNASAGSPRGYYDWIKFEQGESFISTNYATEETVDDALYMMDALPEPWFLFVSFNAALSRISRLHPVALVLDCAVSGATIRCTTRWWRRWTMEMLAACWLGLATEPITRPSCSWAITERHRKPCVGRVMRRRPRGPCMYEGGVNVPMIVVSPDIVEPGSSPTPWSMSPISSPRPSTQRACPRARSVCPSMARVCCRMWTARTYRGG